MENDIIYIKSGHEPRVIFNPKVHKPSKPKELNDGNFAIDFEFIEHKNEEIKDE